MKMVEDLARSKLGHKFCLGSLFTTIVLALGGIGGMSYSAFMQGKIKDRILEPEKPAIVQNISRAENYLGEVSNKIVSLNSASGLPYQSANMKRLYAEELANREQEVSGLEKTMSLVRDDIQEMRNTLESRQYQSEVLSRQSRLEQETYPYAQLENFSFNCLGTGFLSLLGLLVTGSLYDLVYVSLMERRKKRKAGGAN